MKFKILQLITPQSKSDHSQNVSSGRSPSDHLLPITPFGDDGTGAKEADVSSVAGLVLKSVFLSHHLTLPIGLCPCHILHVAKLFALFSERDVATFAFRRVLRWSERWKQGRWGPGNSDPISLGRGGRGNNGSNNNKDLQPFLHSILTRAQ